MTLVEPDVETDASAAADVDPAVVAEHVGNVGVLKRKSKVRAFTDLPGVPEGTRGVVTLVNGWDPWIRYRVLFDNGVDLGSINRPHLAPAKRYEELVRAREQALATGAFDEPEVDEVEADEAGDGEAAAGGGAVVNGVSIPQHLLDRSAAARQRLGA